MRLSLAVAIVLSAALASAEPLSEPSGEPIVRPTPFSLTIAGGVSLGAYEAGLLYYTLDWLRANAARSELRLVTGVSAGSVNGVLATLAHCQALPADPSQSLFYKIWVPLGFEQLFENDRSHRQAVFSRRWLDKVADDIQAGWDQGLRESCDVVLGISVTRAVPRQIAIAGALRAERMEERFSLRIQGRGPHEPPRLTNYVDPDGQGDLLLLPERADGEVPFSALRDLLIASSAVPVAFAPVLLRHCVSSPAARAGPVRCSEASAQEALFVDGSLFDLSPLGLASSLARAGLRELPGGLARWEVAPDFGHPRPIPTLRFVFVSPNPTAYPVAEDRVSLDGKSGLADLIFQELQAFLATTPSKNLYGLLDEFPEIGRQLYVPTRHAPAASSPMGAFLGFFETGFRRYDFTLGMVDARRSLIDLILPRLGPGTDPEALSFPEEAHFGEPAWRSFQCLSAILDQSSSAPDLCRGDDLTDLRILAQTSLERLFHECRSQKGSEPVGPREKLCLLARAGRPVPAVAGVLGSVGDSEPHVGEGEVAWVLRLLSRHHFQFSDLHADGDPDGALRQIRIDLSRAIDSLAGAQSAGSGMLVQRLGNAAANTLLYLPPRHQAWLGLGRELELGYSYGFSATSALAQTLRLHVAVQIDGLDQLLASDGGSFALVPLVGLDLRPPSLSGPQFQFGGLLRGGRSLSTGDSLGTNACTASGSGFGSCSRWNLQAGVYGVVLELVRLQLSVEWLLPERGRKGLWALSPELGIQAAF